MTATILTDDLVASLARLPALTEVVFYVCERVTAVGVAELVANAPVLQWVQFDRCGLTSGDLVQCRQRADAAGKQVQIATGPAATERKATEHFDY